MSTITEEIEDFIANGPVVSFGGGVNSTALLAELANQQVKLRAILFSDTGGEKPETYSHVEYMSKWCIDRGMPEITVVRAKITLEQDCENRETLPSKAFGFGTCSARFKLDPQFKWCKDNGVFPTWLVGIHAGESRRATRLETTHGHPVRYPLIEWNWGQKECLDAIDRAGIPRPVKSACFFCPSTKRHEVLQLKAEHPDLYERAVEMERAALEAGNLQTVKGLGRNWSWDELGKADAMQIRLPIFDDCQAPICDVCVDW